MQFPALVVRLAGVVSYISFLIIAGRLFIGRCPRDSSAGYFYIRSFNYAVEKSYLTRDSLCDHHLAMFQMLLRRDENEATYRVDQSNLDRSQTRN